MSPRAVVRHQQWTLQPDREPDAEPTSYAMQCAMCGDISPTGTEFTASQNWVFAHGGGQTDAPHVPGGHHPPVEGVVETVTGRVAALVARLARYTGPMLIVLVSASCGFVIGVTASTVRIAP